MGFVLPVGVAIPEPIELVEVELMELEVEFIELELDEFELIDVFEAIEFEEPEVD